MERGWREDGEMVERWWRDGGERMARGWRSTQRSDRELPRPNSSGGSSRRCDPNEVWKEVNTQSGTFNDRLGLSKILDINSLIIDTNEL